VVKENMRDLEGSRLASSWQLDFITTGENNILEK